MTVYDFGQSSSLDINNHTNTATAFDINDAPILITVAVVAIGILVLITAVNIVLFLKIRCSKNLVEVSIPAPGLDDSSESENYVYPPPGSYKGKTVIVKKDSLAGYDSIEGTGTSPIDFKTGNCLYYSSPRDVTSASTQLTHFNKNVSPEIHFTPVENDDYLEPIKSPQFSLCRSMNVLPSNHQSPIENDGYLEPIKLSHHGSFGSRQIMPSPLNDPNEMHDYIEIMKSPNQGVYDEPQGNVSDNNTAERKGEMTTIQICGYGTDVEYAKNIAESEGNEMVSPLTSYDVISFDKTDQEDASGDVYEQMTL